MEAAVLGVRINLGNIAIPGIRYIKNNKLITDRPVQGGNISRGDILWKSVDKIVIHSTQIWVIS